MSTFHLFCSRHKACEYVLCNHIPCVLCTVYTLYICTLEREIFRFHVGVKKNGKQFWTLSVCVMEETQILPFFFFGVFIFHRYALLIRVYSHSFTFTWNCQEQYKFSIETDCFERGAWLVTWKRKKQREKEIGVCVYFCNVRIKYNAKLNLSMFFFLHEEKAAEKPLEINRKKQPSRQLATGRNCSAYYCASTGKYVRIRTLMGAD